MKLNIFFLLFIGVISAQNQKSSIVIDAEDRLPIEFVDIYNRYDNTITNEDGKFFFFSTSDSITFSKLGYNKLNTVFSKIKDTIFLTKKAIELEGITLVQTDSLWQKVRRNVKKNYSLVPYNERFFLRGTLKLNDTLVRIQDMQGLLRRKTLLYTKDLDLTNKDFEISLINMRKAGIVTDRNDTYFKFPTFYGLLSTFVRINATGSGFKLIEKPFLDEAKTRYEFSYESNNRSIIGYYIINTNNYAIEEFHTSEQINLDQGINSYNKNKWLRYRTNTHKVSVYFDFNTDANKYFIKNASFLQQVECTNEEKSFKNIYESKFILNTYDNFGDFKVKKNTSAIKDIFKIKHKYDDRYWKEQNQLLLTDEMIAFIEKMGAKNKEFKIRSNIK